MITTKGYYKERLFFPLPKDLANIVVTYLTETSEEDRIFNHFLSLMNNRDFAIAVQFFIYQEFSPFKTNYTVMPDRIEDQMQVLKCRYLIRYIVAKEVIHHLTILYRECIPNKMDDQVTQHIGQHIERILLNYPKEVLIKMLNVANTTPLFDQKPLKCLTTIITKNLFPNIPFPERINLRTSIFNPIEKAVKAYEQFSSIYAGCNYDRFFKAVEQVKNNKRKLRDYDVRASMALT